MTSAEMQIWKLNISCGVRAIISSVFPLIIGTFCKIFRKIKNVFLSLNGVLSLRMGEDVVHYISDKSNKTKHKTQMHIVT